MRGDNPFGKNLFRNDESDDDVVVVGVGGLLVVGIFNFCVAVGSRGLAAALVVVVGYADIPPSKNEPPILIPAVCQPVNLFHLFGSDAIYSAATRPT